MKIYFYKEGKAYFENNEKKQISDEAYDLLFTGKTEPFNGHAEKREMVWSYIEKTGVWKSRFTEMPLSIAIDYAKSHNLKRERLNVEKFEVYALYENGEIVALEVVNERRGTMSLNKFQPQFEENLAQVKKMMSNVK